jgi:hypothetical protein
MAFGRLHARALAPSRRQLAEFALERRPRRFPCGRCWPSVRPRGRGTSGSCARRRGARAGRCCSRLQLAASASSSLRSSSQDAAASVSRLALLAGIDAALSRRCPSAAACRAGAGRRGFGDCITVMGVPSIVRQPLSWLPWRSACRCRAPGAGAAVDRALRLRCPGRPGRRSRPAISDRVKHGHSRSPRRKGMRANVAGHRIGPNRRQKKGPRSGPLCWVENQGSGEAVPFGSKIRSQRCSTCRTRPGAWPCGSASLPASSGRCRRRCTLSVNTPPLVRNARSLSR